MNNRTFIKKKANEVLKRFNICSPNLDDLVHIIKYYDFEVIDYELGNGHSSIDTLVSELSLESVANNNKAFTYQNGDIRLVFVCYSMMSEEKCYALAHELGHIVCGHLKDGLCNNVDIFQEYEANEFAHYLLNPNAIFQFIQWVRTHKSKTYIAVLSFALILVFLLAGHRILMNKSYYGEYYISESGEKYHLKDCIYVKDRNNIHRLTVDEFESGKYLPCQICLPDEK